MQPLSRVSSTATVSFGQIDTMTSRPEIALRIADCISKWADIETMLAILLSLLLNAEEQPILAMYAALENRTSQLRALTAAAKSKLPPHEFEIFEVLRLRFVRPVMKERDRLAHWCWGYSGEIPDALLLTEPNEKVLVHIKVIDKAPSPILDRGKIFVVKAPDLDRTLARLATTTDYLSKFMGAMWPKNPSVLRGPLLQRLCNEPHFRSALDRHRASRCKSQSACPPSPESTPKGE